MDVGGGDNNGGGFHGYRRLPQTGGSDVKAPPDTTMNLLPPHSIHHHPGGGDEVLPECVVREQDRFMPIANVIRIMRRILPPHAKISDDAKETIQECVSEYISFITGEANDRCQREQRKTITAEDVLWAMSKLGFDDYIEPLTVYLHRYRELDGGDRGSVRGDPLATVKRAPPPAPEHHHHHHGMGGGFSGFHPPPQVAFHYGYYGGPPVNLGFFKDNGSVGPSHVVGVDPFPQCKEPQL